jgi:putrescine aminotransferase
MSVKKYKTPFILTEKERTLEEEFKHVLGLIYKEDSLNEEECTYITEEVVEYWEENVNPGFLEYRKSVSEEGTAIEWIDGEEGGAIFRSMKGIEYIDCLGGFGIFNVGHRHPKVVAAVRAQLKKQALHSQELLDPLRAYCAHLLALICPGDLQYSFFTNSGTESVEACLKMAMLSTGRTSFVATVGAFHGKSMGALSGTSKAAYRNPFKGALLDFTHLPLNDIAALEAHFEGSEFTGNAIAGVVLEVVQGEGGINLATNDYLRMARRLCTKYGACLIFDEVQTGMGRTGKMWGCDHANVCPDIMAIGKAFGGGVMPTGACIGTAQVWKKFVDNPFIMTTTFGGNPLAMAAAISAMEVIHSEGLVQQAKDKGDYFIYRLKRLQAQYPMIVKEARGLGLMLGLEFHSNEFGYAFSAGTFKRGVLVSGTLVNARVVRIEPPLTITREQIEKVLDIMTSTLDEIESNHDKQSSRM